MITASKRQDSVEPLYEHLGVANSLYINQYSILLGASWSDTVMDAYQGYLIPCFLETRISIQSATKVMFPSVLVCLSVSNVTEQERQGRWFIFGTGWSHWIDYLVKEYMMKVVWPGSNQIILLSGLKIVVKSQSNLWRLITNSSANSSTSPRQIPGIYAKTQKLIILPRYAN